MREKQWIKKEYWRKEERRGRKLKDRKRCEGKKKKLIIRKSEERKIKKNPRKIIKTLLIQEVKLWKERLV